MIQRSLNAFLCLCTLLLIAFTAISQTPPDIGYESKISGLTAPMDIINAGDGSNRLFVVQKGGVIRVYDSLLNYLQDFLSVAGVATTDEGGLLSAAFHPSYETNGFVFVYYTRADDNSLEIARYSASGNVADAASKQIVLNIQHPGQRNHNGGKILFGPDGYLYLATGDGGGAGDIPNNAQNGNSLLGKMIRINVNTLPYTIPADNPYISDPNVADEIWAIGLRNPFRWSFDRANGDMWIADVGQGTQEEINYRPAGATAAVNYGWRCYEGISEYNMAGCSGNYTAPIFTYGRSNTTGGQSVTGGFVYRGAEFPALSGYYIFTDYISDNQWVITPDRTQMLQLPDEGLPADIVAFGEAENGVLYAASLSGNAIYKVVDNAALPVNFGSINAVRKGNNLHISWVTATEANNNYFEIEASVDGKNFTSVQTVKSKALNGNSSSNISYEVTLGKDSLQLVFGFSMIALLSVIGFRSRNKWSKVSHLAIAFLMIATACNKKDSAVDPANNTVFIRIAQVDIDGTKKYSQVVQVINE